MPACAQCGKDNPEGTAFCGHCASPLKVAADEPEAKPYIPPSMRASSQTKPSIRTPTFHTPAPVPKGQPGFEWIPWSELSTMQKAGRSLAVAIAALVLILLVRAVFHSVRGGSTAANNAPSVEGTSGGAPITEGDRKDGIESLCKVFQIYGLPANDKDASEAARNAGELYKLAGNQSPERSAYILQSIATDFRSGKLGANDCAQAGAPLPTHVDTLGGPDSGQNSNP